VVTVGVRGAGGDDQPPGGDVVAVLLPQPGPGWVERGGLPGQLPCPVQDPRLVRLVGRRRRPVSLHAGTVAGLGRARLPRILLALRGEVVRVSGGRRVCRTRYRLGPLCFGLLTALRAAGLLAGWRGMIRLLLRHAVECLADFPDPLAGGGEFLCVRELLADGGAGVVDLAAGVVDLCERVSLAGFQLGKAVFQPGDQADRVSVAQGGGGYLDRRAGRAVKVDGHVRRAERPGQLRVHCESGEAAEVY
jgi:hypothetical protein